MNMRVLVISQYFWPENFRINELVKSLQCKGLVIEVLTGQPNYPSGVIFEGYNGWNCTVENWSSVKIYRVPLFPRGRSAVSLGINYLSFIFSAILFGPWLLRGKSFDAIFIFGVSPILQAIPAIFLGKIKNCPLILWIQDLWPESLLETGYVTHKGLLKIVEYVVGWIYHSMDLLLVQSKAFIAKVANLAGSVPVNYYPNSFLEQGSEKLDSKPNITGFDCSFPILFAGNIGRAQAVEVILGAAALLEGVGDISIIMVGDGSRREWMMREVSKRGLRNIIFVGQLPVEVMPAIMAQASGLLVTLVDKEIFRLTIPSKIQAYLAAGRPIIASLNGAGAEIINDAQAGVVVPAENPEALADAIRSMYLMPEIEKLAMGINGRRYYEENFSSEKLIEQLIEYFNKAIKNYHKAVT